MLCKSLFVLLSVFFWPLCCLSFFNLQILITPLVSSNLEQRSTVYKIYDMDNWLCWCIKYRTIITLYSFMTIYITHTIVVIDTDYTGSCKSNYHIITMTTAPKLKRECVESELICIEICHQQAIKTHIIFNMPGEWHSSNSRNGRLFLKVLYYSYILGLPRRNQIPNNLPN